MKKKIKINSLYLVVLGDVTNIYRHNKKYTIREETPVLAYAKYYLFHKGTIKFFQNVLDKSKYSCKESTILANSLCAVRYCPVSVFMNQETLKRGYIYEDEIEKYLNNIFARKFIEETIDLFEDKKIERKSLDFPGDQIKKSMNESHIPQRNYYTVLTDNTFTHEPIVGREREISNLILTLAQIKNNPLLIGNSGVGKTALIDELAYMIQNGKVPNILKDRIIIETSAGEILSGTKYRGEMEEKLIELSKIIKENNAILFIDNFHNVLKSGSNDDSSVDIASMLKKLIDRDNIKVIGSTTRENYDNFILQSDLKDRFEAITVEEPNDMLLYDIIEYTLDNYSKILNISIDNLNENIINLLIDLTRKKHRRYNDSQNNPRLVVGIIDKAFAAAASEDSPQLTYDHIISSINANERIYDSKKVEIMKQIENISLCNEQKQKGRILILTK